MFFKMAAIIKALFIFAYTLSSNIQSCTFCVHCHILNVRESKESVFESLYMTDVCFFICILHKNTVIRLALCG